MSMCVKIFLRRRLGCRRMLLFLGIFVVVTVLKVLTSTSDRREPLSLHRTSNTLQPRTFIEPNIAILRRQTQPLCDGLFRNDEKVIGEAYEYMRTHEREVITEENYITMTKNCASFLETRGYIMKPLSQEESDFSIAYSMLMYKDIDQAERLLRAVYMPQNYYCIHVDLDASKSVRDAMRSIATCLPNVFISSKSLNVHWGTMSVLEADLNCMEELLQFKRWKYFINLTGQEMPLLSNREMVRVLKALNGSNNIDATVKRRNVRRTAYEHAMLFWIPSLVYMTFKRKSPPPRNILITKGSVHIVVKRSYVQYVIHDPLAKQFREWVRDTWVPDETFFSSLNHNPKLNVPGSFLGEPETDSDNFITRYKNWGEWPCQGKWARGICIPGIRDLMHLKNRKQLIVNKFHQDFEHLTLDCIEELQFNRTVASARPDFNFDDSYYKQLSFVRNHL